MTTKERIERYGVNYAPAYPLEEMRQTYLAMMDEAEREFQEFLQREDETDTSESATELVEDERNWEDDGEFYDGSLDSGGDAETGDYFFDELDPYSVVSIGDYIEGSPSGKYRYGGTVIGTIRNRRGKPVCYKVWSCGPKGEGFDYIPADEVALHELCGDSDWALGENGYKKVEDDTEFSYSINEETGDVIVWE